MCRPSLHNCTSSEINFLADTLHGITREKLIFAAGVANNKTLQKELGSGELANFYEGVRAADPGFINPYWPER